MNSMTMNPAREVCAVDACIHEFHDVDRTDCEDFVFHETAPIVVVDSPRFERVDVRVSRFDNESQWYIDARVRKVITVDEALALADALRAQAEVANELNTAVGRMSAASRTESLRRSVGFSIRSLRHLAGMTLDEVALAADTSVAYLNKVETGKFVPTKQYVAQVTTAIADRLRSAA